MARDHKRICGTTNMLLHCPVNPCAMQQKDLEMRYRSECNVARHRHISSLSLLRYKYTQAWLHGDIYVQTRLLGSVHSSTCACDRKDVGTSTCACLQHYRPMGPWLLQVHMQNMASAHFEAAAPQQPYRGTGVYCSSSAVHTVPPAACLTGLPVITCCRNTHMHPSLKPRVPSSAKPA
jgi:hypothetical protein